MTDIITLFNDVLTIYRNSDGYDKTRKTLSAIKNCGNSLSSSTERNQTEN